MLTDDDLLAIQKMMAALLEDHGLKKRPRAGALRMRRLRERHKASQPKSQSVTVQGATRHKSVTPQHNAVTSAAPSKATWIAYAEAYRQRYGVDPTRNATVNGQLAQFVSRVPAADAPAIAAFFVHHNKSFYVASRHAVGALLKDAEGLRTQWLSGQSITDTEARQADQTQARGNVFGKLIAEEEERNGK